MTELVEPLPSAVPQPARSDRQGYLLYIVASFLFAINGTVVKGMLIAGLAPIDLSQLRATGSFVLLFAFLAITNPGSLRLRRSELPLLVAYGIVGIAATQFLYFVSIMTIPIGIALLVEFTSPLMVALWFRFGLKHPTRPIVWVALVCALGGLAIVAQIWNGLTLDGFGLLCAAGAAMSVAFYYVAADAQVRRPNPRDPVSLTMWGMGFAALFWAVASPWWRFPFGALVQAIPVFGTSGPIVPAALPAFWMILLGTLVPFSLTVLSMQHLRASQASAMGITEPVIATVVAWICLGQTLAPIQLVGAAVALGSVYVAERNRT